MGVSVMFVVALIEFSSVTITNTCKLTIIPFTERERERERDTEIHTAYNEASPYDHNHMDRIHR